MQTKALFNQLFDYNFHCNKVLIEQCHTLKGIPERCIELFNHILNSHHIWNHRILEIPVAFEVWQEHTLIDWQEIHYENQRTTFEIVTNAEDLDRRIDYQNSEGVSYSNALSDILFHIINHSTHHRAQILADFRQHGINPKALDYIFYRR